MLNFGLLNTIVPIFAEIPYTIIIYFAIGTIVIYISWRSTFVSLDEIRSNPYRHRTVYIFNARTGDFQPHALNLLLNNRSLDISNTPPTLESILDEMNGITYRPPRMYDEPTDYIPRTLEERRELLNVMDRDLRVRQDRTNNTTTENMNTATGDSVTTNDDAASSTSTSASPSPSLSSISPISQTTNGSDTPTVDNVDSNLSNSDYLAEEEITIKIKYLNDSMKTVKARPSEPIGDFKKRTFNEELGANKIVRLVFNGHVLQPDEKTVTACGLFDNCVVHCLIHNARVIPTVDTNQTSNDQQSPRRNEIPSQTLGMNNFGMESNPNRNRNTQQLLKLSLILIGISVIISWFFRIQYFQLFSWYSTVGLILLTMFFLVVIPLIFIIEREILRNL